jgi:hypothetical protein
LLAFLSKGIWRFMGGNSDEGNESAAMVTEIDDG